VQLQILVTRDKTLNKPIYSEADMWMILTQKIKLQNGNLAC